MKGLSTEQGTAIHSTAWAKNSGILLLPIFLTPSLIHKDIFSFLKSKYMLNLISSFPVLPSTPKPPPSLALPGSAASTLSALQRIFSGAAWWISLRFMPDHIIFHWDSSTVLSSHAFASSFSLGLCYLLHNAYH